MTAVLFTWPAIQAAASDCAAGTGAAGAGAAGAGGAEAGCLGTGDRTACGAVLDQTAVS
jgi:hypothetical protein